LKKSIRFNIRRIRLKSATSFESYSESNRSHFDSTLIPSLTNTIEAIERFQAFPPDIRETARRLAASEFGISYVSLCLLERLQLGGAA
jgi:hypothetical protein